LILSGAIHPVLKVGVWRLRSIKNNDNPSCNLHQVYTCGK